MAMTELSAQNSAKLDKWSRHGLYAALLIYIACRVISPMGETDLFFHLKIGDLIVAEHAIPFRNLFSFTYPDHPDLDLSWAFQVLVSLLYRLGGFGAIILLKVACVLGAAMLVHRTCRRLFVSPAAAAIATLLMILAAEQRLVERPHLITLVGLAVLNLLLLEIDRGKRRLLWLLPPFAMLWANFHAGVFLCVVVLACDRITARLAGDKTFSWRQLFAVLALTTAATMMTPAGRQLPAYLLWHAALGSTRNIEEFRYADPFNDPWFFVLLALSAIGAIFAGRAALHRVVPVLCVAALAWRSVRFVAEWAILAAPLVALGLHRIGRTLAPLISGRIVRVAIAAVLLLAAGRERLRHPLKRTLSDDVVPFSAIRFATQNGLRERLYHDLDVGCYLLWEGFPRYRVFQDARLPAYPDAFHRSLDETPLTPEAFDKLLAQYGVDAALISEPDINMRAGSFDPEKWALVYRRNDALIFARRNTRHDAIITRYEIPLRIRFRFLGGSSVEALPHPPQAGAISQCDWDLRLAKAWTAEERPDSTLAALLAAVEHHCMTLDEARRAYTALGHTF